MMKYALKLATMVATLVASEAIGQSQIIVCYDDLPGTYDCSTWYGPAFTRNCSDLPCIRGVCLAPPYYNTAPVLIDYEIPFANFDVGNTEAQVAWVLCYRNRHCKDCELNLNDGQRYCRHDLFNPDELDFYIPRMDPTGNPCPIITTAIADEREMAKLAAK